MQNLRLYTYFRSGSSHRVRIALALKGIAYDSVPVHLLRDGGEHLKPAYRAVNPQARVPALLLPGGEVLIQSPAILEYLEETVPHPPLLPADPVARAKVRGVAAIIGCDIHPLNNVAALSALRRLGQDEAAGSAWISRWITEGFEAVEQLIGQDGWCFGANPGLADVYLVPQLFSANRFKVPLDRFPRIRRVAGLSDAHLAFVAAAPESQPDAL
jgi:maleylpyruvate isomerase